VVDEPSKDDAIIVSKKICCYKTCQHTEPLKDLGIPGMNIEEFLEDGAKDYNEFEYGKLLVTKQAHVKLL
jgi:hypothetical protein